MTELITPPLNLVSEPKSSLITPELQRVLSQHVVDFKPESNGDKAKIAKLGDPYIGIAGSDITRGDCNIRVEEMTLDPGKVVVMVGKNGAGKSTICDALMETRDALISTRNNQGCHVISPHTPGRDFVRVARLNQEEIFTGIENLKARDVFDQTAQYYLSLLPNEDTTAQLWSTDPDQAQAVTDAQLRIEELQGRIMNLFDIQEFETRSVNQLSGGERTKLALFMILLSEPDVLIADEPTNHLDLKSIGKLKGLFDIYKKAGKSIMAISHINWLLKDAGQDGVIEVAWEQEGRTARTTKSRYADFVQNPNRQNNAFEGDIVWAQPEYDRKKGNVLVQKVDNASIANSPLTNFAFGQVGAGDAVVLIGDNGTGKTTLLNRIIHPTSGEANDLGKEKKVNAAYLPQFWPDNIARGTLGEFFDWVKEAASPHSTGAAENISLTPQKSFERKLKMLRSKSAKTIALDRPLSTFSGGEQRLLWFLAVSSLRDIDLLVLDEPTNHMDAELSDKVTKAITQWNGAVVVATHDRDPLHAVEKRETGLLHTVVLTKRNGKTKIRETNMTPGVIADQIYQDAIGTVSAKIVGK